MKYLLTCNSQATAEGGLLKEKSLLTYNIIG
jgi:hypothetical protein